MARLTTSDSPAGRRRATRLFAHLRWAALERYLRAGRMWHRVYRVVSYTRSSLWIAPILALIAVLALAAPIRWLDAWLDWPFASLDLEGARALYGTVITLTLSFIVFTFGSLLVAIQVASGQLTPRIIETALLRDNVVRLSVGLFVFSMLFALSALRRMQTDVYEITFFTAALLGMSCIATFLYLIDYAARLLRPVSIVARVSDHGIAVIEDVYRDY